MVCSRDAEGALDNLINSTQVSLLNEHLHKLKRDPGNEQLWSKQIIASYIAKRPFQIAAYLAV